MLHGSRKLQRCLKLTRKKFKNELRSARWWSHEQRRYLYCCVKCLLQAKRIRKSYHSTLIGRVNLSITKLRPIWATRKPSQHILRNRQSPEQNERWFKTWRGHHILEQSRGCFQQSWKICWHWLPCLNYYDFEWAPR